MARKIKSRSLSLGVIGLGHMGQLHVKKLKTHPQVGALLGIEKNLEQAHKITAQYEISVFPSLEDVSIHLDACVVATPTISHYETALKCLERGISVLIEKPVTENVSEAFELKKVAEKNKCIIQVGHLERFQPAFVKSKNILKAPLFIESHRLGIVKERSFDIDVILDLMIHDIDLILHIVSSPVIKVEGLGISVLTKKIDLANARIYFENEAVAQLTASRVSLKEMRKIRFFQQGAYVSVDSLEGKTTVVQFNPEHAASPQESFDYEVFEQSDSDALYSQLQSFLEALIEKRVPLVTIDDAIRSLKVAFDIRDSIYEKMKKVQNRYHIPHQHMASLHS